ncbi:MAG: diphosphomevalonate decarboxylase, partial [Cyanobacteria bacterium REEB65]|nr:diphosphomevalonate decarboxylase [Cyanobacteria bacterium REEB65]
MKVKCRACANIALVKYWGKRDAALNLPATGSLSLTLAGLTTTTSVEFIGDTGDAAAPGDEITLDAWPAAAEERDRIVRFLDHVRQVAGIRAPARVESVNDFPRAAGLASSASGFAALALAATRAAGLDLSRSELSALARQGSGSACRSVFGGFVEWQPGAAV